MSEMYEGIVLPAGADRVRAAFDALRSSLSLRLAELAPGVSGVWRAAGREDRFAVEAVNGAAAQFARALGCPVLAVFYDNQIGLREAELFDATGEPSRFFGEEDEWWVPLDDDGGPLRDGPRFRVGELEAQGEDAEFETFVTAADAGLEALGVANRVHPDMLKRTFVYEDHGWVAERRPL